MSTTTGSNRKRRLAVNKSRKATTSLSLGWADISPFVGRRMSSADTTPHQTNLSSRDRVIFDTPSTLVVGPFARSHLGARFDEMVSSQSARSSEGQAQEAAKMWARESAAGMNLSLLPTPPIIHEMWYNQAVQPSAHHTK
jgi:hypothetical protein